VQSKSPKHKSSWFGVFAMMCCMVAVVSGVHVDYAWAQNDKAKVELSGDELEYDRDTSEVIITGNVEIKYKGTTLLCDRADFSQSTQIAHAYGNVRLKTPQGELKGDELTFDYTTMTGDFMGAKILAHPYYGGGEKVRMEEGNKIVMTNGYVTTSDYDKPEYRVASKRIDVYPGDKVVASSVKLKLKDASLMYLPKYWHRIDDTKHF